MGNFVQDGYLTDHRGNVSIIISQHIDPGYSLSALKADSQEARGNFFMDSEGCRSITANMELQTARDMYETRTVSKNKRKISALQASVKAEELSRTEEDIAQEVNWLQDLGIASNRATQFVRTQAESWRIKTLLARALDSREEVKQPQSADFIPEA